MLELYWITRIGIINDVAIISAVLAATGALTATILWGMFDEGQESMLKRQGKRLFYGFIVSTLVAVITPNKEDLYLIYGVGGIVDYVQTNDKAKQLPDECVNALINWANNLNEKKEK